MKRIGTTAIALAVVIGLVIGFGVNQLLTAFGRATFVPATSLPIVLAVLAVACLAFAWPIRQQLRRKRDRHVDPIRALRIVTLARASSLVGAITAGFAGGLMLFGLTRPVMPSVGSITTIGVTIGAAIVLVVCALIAESFCVLPKDDDDNPAAGTDQP